MGECLISRRGGEVYKLPILNPSYPQNATVKASSNGTVSFSVAISEDGKPAEYTYQWYVNGSAVSGATGKNYVRNVSAVGVFTVYCVITNKAGSVSSRDAVLNVVTPIPVASNIYNGNCELKKENEYDWCLYCYGSGDFVYPEDTILEVCIVGGGAGGRLYSTIHDQGEDGGGGGTVVNRTGISVTAGTTYPIVVGAGGNLSTWSSTGGWHGEGGEGGTSSAFGFTAAGGQTGKGNAGLSKNEANATAGGAGTYAFGDTSLPRYGGGGGGGADDWYKPGAGGAGGGGRGGYGKAAGKTDSASANAIAGAANTGGGGGGAGEGYAEGYDNAVSGNAAKGGSGIVLIRNAR